MAYSFASAAMSSCRGSVFSSYYYWGAARDSSSSTAMHVENDTNQGSLSKKLTMTSAAVDRLKALRLKKGEVDLRVLVDGGGCSGFQYVFEIDSDGPKQDDYILEEGGVRLLCDSVSMEFLHGSTIDFQSDLMMSKFVVSENPNAEMGCGCGSSFAVGNVS